VFWDSILVLSQQVKQTLSTLWQKPELSQANLLIFMFHQNCMYVVGCIIDLSFVCKLCNDKRDRVIIVYCRLKRSKIKAAVAYLKVPIHCSH